MAYTLLDNKRIYTGAKVSLELRHYQNDQGQVLERAICVHPGAVCVLPLLDRDTILLIRNYRLAVGEQLLELPAGTLEKGEDPENCAGRELLEETGYHAERIESLGDFYTSPGVLTEKMHCFAAYDLQKRNQALEVGEDIEVVPTAFVDVLRMIDSGEVQDGKSIAIILKYARRRLQSA